MPAKKKTIPTTTSGPKRKAVAASRPTTKTSATLPTQRSEISTNLNAYTWLIHGEPKIGKTSLISEFGEVLFLMFEPGGKSLRIYQTPTIINWGDVTNGYIRQLQEDKKNFTAVCIDTGSKAYDCCLDWVCKREGIRHPGEVNDYGASWKLVSREFIEAHSRIASCGLGFFVTAHSRYIERVDKLGKSESKIEPILSGALDEFYRGVIDIIAYYHFSKGKRYLQIRGDETVVAGCRLTDNFLTPNGDPIIRIPMGTSTGEANENIEKAFKNKQVNTYGNITVDTPKKKMTIKPKKS